MTETRRLTPTLLAFVLVCAFSFGAIVKLAFADDYHVACVGHGFMHGGSQTDNYFYARVEAGCGTTWRSCDLYVSGSYIGGLTTLTGSQCTAASMNYGNYTECHGTAHLTYPPYFGEHVHKASNWCG